MPRTEVVLSNAMMKVIELEATLAVLQTKAKKNKNLYKLRWWMSSFICTLKYR